MCRKARRWSKPNKETTLMGVCQKDAGAKEISYKEKYGLLTFECCPCNSVAQDIIENIETRSEVICEECGKPGSQVEVRGWIKTLCQECMKEIQGEK